MWQAEPGENNDCGELDLFSITHRKEYIWESCSYVEDMLDLYCELIPTLQLSH